jgi:hypothetical protein
MSENLPEIPPISIPYVDYQESIYKFAAIVDGQLVGIFRVQSHTASIYANNPTFIQVSENFEAPLGSTWDGNNFIVERSV